MVGFLHSKQLKNTSIRNFRIPNLVLSKMMYNVSFSQRVKSLEYKTEVSLKLYLESIDPAGYQETWDRTKYKLDTIKSINKI